MPSRIQQQRAKGWRKPRGAVSVARPGPFGNPFKIAHDTSGWWAMVSEQHGHWFGHDGERRARNMAVILYREHLTDADRELIRDQLAGRDLMCFCKLCPAHASGKPAGVRCNDCEPCHADVILEIANA